MLNQEDDDVVDLSFFAEEDEQPAQDTQENTVSVDKAEYERLKQQQEEQRRQAEEAANAQKVESITPYAELENLIAQKAEQIFEAKKGELREEATWEQAAQAAMAKYPDLAKDKATVAYIDAKTNEYYQQSVREGNPNKIGSIEKAVQDFQALRGQQDRSRNYRMMNPDVRGAQQPPEKKVDIASMSSEEFEALDAKVRQAHMAGKRVVI